MLSDIPKTLVSFALTQQGDLRLSISAAHSPSFAKCTGRTLDTHRHPCSTLAILLWATSTHTPEAVCTQCQRSYTVPTIHPSGVFPFEGHCSGSYGCPSVLPKTIKQMHARTRWLGLKYMHMHQRVWPGWPSFQNCRDAYFLTIRYFFKKIKFSRYYFMLLTTFYCVKKASWVELGCFRTLWVAVSKKSQDAGMVTLCVAHEYVRVWWLPWINA